MMQVKIEIDENCPEPVVTIKTAAMTEEISKIIRQLTAKEQNLIAGFDAETVELLEANQVIRFYSANQKVFAQTASKEYIVRLRLYELEEWLDKKLFVRISNSEIINLKAVKRLDLSFTGTIAVELSGGETTYVSRRYVAKIKNVLGI